MDDPALNKQPQTTSSIPAMAPPGMTQDDSSPPPPIPPIPNQDLSQTPPPAGAGAGPNDAVIPETPSPSTGRKRFGGGKFIATIFGVLLLLGGTIVGVYLIGNQQLFFQKASVDIPAGWTPKNCTFEGNAGVCKCTFCEPTNPVNCIWDETGGKSSGLCAAPVAPPTGTGISCPGGTCADGFTYLPDTNAPQATCEIRANDACQTHGGPAAAGGGTGTGGGTQTSGSADYGCDGNGCTLTGLPASNGCSVYQYKCANQFGLPCNQNATACSSSGCSKTFEANFCGTQQIDIRCPKTSQSALGLADVSCGPASCTADYVSLINGQTSAACTGTGTGGGGGCVVQYSQAGHNSCITNPPGCPPINVWQFHAPGTPNTQGQCFTSANKETVVIAGGDRICVPEIPCGYCYQLDVDAGVNPGINTGGVSGYTTDCTTTTTGISAQCLTIKIYDEAGTLLTAADYTDLTPGQTIRLAVGGSTTAGAFDKARFTTNGTLNAETALKNTAGEFYMDYVLPEATTFTFDAQLHHTDTTIGTGGWF